MLGNDIELPDAARSEAPAATAASMSSSLVPTSVAEDDASPEPDSSVCVGCFRHFRQLEHQLEQAFYPTSTKRSSEDDDYADVEVITMTNFYGVIIYELHVEPNLAKALLWAFFGVLLVTLQLFAVFAIFFSSVARTCIYDDDCALGYVCSVWRATPGTTTTPVCLACSIFTRGPDAAAPDDFFGLDLLARAVDGADWSLTPRRRLLFPADNASHFCEQSIAQPAVRAWPEPPVDFTTSRCPKTSESALRATLFDYVVLTSAFLFIATHLASDRHQQLLNRQMRYRWFPPPHRDWRAATLKLIEMLLARGLLPNVMVAFLALISATSFSAQDVLLNGLSMLIVLIIDDELVKVIVSFPRRLRVEKAIAAAAKGVVPFRELQLQSSCCLLLWSVAMAVGFGLLVNAKCFAVPAAVSVWPGFIFGIVFTTLLELAVHFAATGTLQERLEDRRALAWRVAAELIESFAALGITLAIFALAGIAYFD